MNTKTNTEAVTVDGASALPAIDLSSIGGTAKGKTASKYPLHPDPTGDIAQLVPLVKQEKEAMDTAKGNYEIHRAELTALVVPFYFDTNNGRTDVPSSVACKGTDGDGNAIEALVCFENRLLKTTDTTAVRAAMGQDRFTRFGRQGYTIKIDGDLIPPAVAGELIPELVALFNKHGVTGALSKDEVVTVTPDFFTSRFTAFTPDENRRLHMALPVRTSVKTKGRKK